MQAVLIRQFGGPEALVFAELPDPEPAAGQVLIEVKAFGVNHAETHMRRGEWPESAPVSGIECVGVVRADPSGRLAPGQTVVALMGGMGRSINGSYAELTVVPASNVLAVETELAWEELAAIPESYATAWACLHGNLGIAAGQSLLIRGATSSLGQAALNIAADAGLTVLATSRDPARFDILRDLGAAATLRETPDLAAAVRAIVPGGVDAVLDLVGNSTILDSLAAARPGGHVCEAGWLGGLAPIAALNPMMQMPSRVHWSLFGSFVFGTPDFPLSDIPMQSIVDRVAAGRYKAKPARVFPFAEIRDAHRLMESGAALGKLVVRVAR